MKYLRDSIFAATLVDCDNTWSRSKIPHFILIWEIVASNLYITSQLSSNEKMSNSLKSSPTKNWDNKSSHKTIYSIHEPLSGDEWTGFPPSEDILWQGRGRARLRLGGISLKIGGLAAFHANCYHLYLYLANRRRPQPSSRLSSPLMESCKHWI